MRILSSATALSFAALVVVALTGCVDPDPVITPEPSSSVAPVFESEEDALAAAEEAYAAYLAVLDQIFMDGGQEAGRVEAVATGEQLTAELEGFEEIRELGYRSTGGTTFDQMTLQQFSPEGGPEFVIVYVCEDVTNVGVFDQAGNSVVSPNRPDRTLFQVSFESSADDLQHLLVFDKEAFTEDPC